MSRRKRYTRNLGRRLPEPLPVRTTVESVRFEHAREPYIVRWQDRHQAAVVTFRDTPRLSAIRTLATTR